jgi:hypothetical protein
MTSKQSQAQFTAPIFKTANGDQLLITITGNVNKYISSRQLKCNWPDAEGVDTSFSVAVGQKRFDLTMKHVVQVATTREQTQHRYVIANLGKILLNLVCSCRSSLHCVRLLNYSSF